MPKNSSVIWSNTQLQTRMSGNSAQRLFEAYATDQETRIAIDNMEYGTLGNAISVREYGQVPEGHREAIPNYIRNLNWQTT